MYARLELGRFCLLPKLVDNVNTVAECKVTTITKVARRTQRCGFVVRGAHCDLYW